MSTNNESSAFPYELRTFPVQLVDGKAPDAVIKWSEAVALGFYGDVPSAEEITKYAALEQVDGRMAMGAYLTADATPAGAWGPDYPVSTYAYHRKDLNVGGGTLLPVHQITAVTVRPSHRRRGILRAMITADLARAKADGLPMAALTASEAVIYGRFGFGVATQICEVEVNTRNGLALHSPTAAAQGVVEVADASVVADLHHDLFAKVHAATYGSIGRHEMYRMAASGQGNYGAMEAAKNVRAALHYGPDGVVDGYVSYKPAELAVSIVDFLATTDAAYLALWSFLGSLDLIETVTWKLAPEVDPVEWAMVAKRDYKRKETEDHLWLRILDTEAALAARHFGHDGTVTLRVDDPLGHAGGTFRLDVAGGAATVTSLPDTEQPEISFGVSELSSAYLGAVSAHTLAAAGRLEEHVAGAVERFDALFGSPVTARSLTNF
ncbi:MAG: GNAT family N-acetyltransferase [Specibacter sp.]